MTYVDNGTIHPGSQLTALPWPHVLFVFRHVSIHIHRPQQYKGLDCWDFNQPFLPFAELWGLILGIREASAPFTLSPEGGTTEWNNWESSSLFTFLLIRVCVHQPWCGKARWKLEWHIFNSGDSPLVLSPLLFSFHLMNQLFWQGGDRSLPGSLSHLEPLFPASVKCCLIWHKTLL